MTSSATVGIDLGTQSTKAAIVSSNGVPLAEASVDVSYDQARPGWAEQGPEIILQSAALAIHRAVDQLPEGVAVEGISVAAQMGGAIGVDSRFTPVTPHEMWLDTRSDEDRRQVMEAVGDRVLRENGIIPFVGPRVRRWLREQPSLRRGMARVVAPAGYLAACLCDLSADDAVCDRTQANLFGCFDVAENSWDRDLSRLIGLPDNLLPRIVEPTDIVGHLSIAAAEACGLKAGVPVCAGTGDGTGGWLAAGATKPGICVDTGGSSAHFAITVSRFLTDPTGGLSCMPSAIPGCFYLLGYTTGTGITHRWLTQLLHSTYEDMEQAAAALPAGSNSLLCIPHLHGRVTPYEPDVRGAFVGFDESTDAAGLYRALLESIAYEILGWIDQSKGMLPGFEVSQVHGVGGGSRSALWAQIKADVIGAPYLQLQGFVNAARGAALVAAAGVGVCRIGEPAWFDSDLIVEKRQTPVESRTSDYQELSRLYHDLLDCLSGIYQQLGARKR